MSSIQRLACISALLASPLVLMGCGGSAETTAAPTAAPTTSAPTSAPVTPAPTPVSFGECDDILMGTPFENEEEAPSDEDYAKALKGLNVTAVEEDMTALLKTSNKCWPADFADEDGNGGNYGPFMIRLAWHCAGTYRNTDNRGGCAGGLQRFEPERSWPDNTNLDKARALVYPLKKKYGAALSWGDLFILAGSQALKDSGAKISRICYGRIDERDGSRSAKLGEACDKQGDCSAPHGTKEVGLIYVNPGGHNSDGKPKGLVKDIKDTFQRMGADPEATVALIGGGHTLGKSHGACEGNAGKSPKDAFKDEEHIWKGTCGDGKGKNTFTSGFEGQWTSNPLKWDNEFFKDLLPTGKTWESYTGPGGAGQWKAEGTDNIRLTSDMALLEDPAYLEFVKKFAEDQNVFNDAFDKAWEDLTISHVGGQHAGKWSAEAKCNDKSKPGTSMRMDEGPEFVV